MNGFIKGTYIIDFPDGRLRRAVTSARLPRSRSLSEPYRRASTKYRYPGGRHPSR